MPCHHFSQILGYFVQNLKSNLTMWKLGTLPPSLIAFKGHVHPIDPFWHMLGLGYQNNTNIESVKKAAVIHYNGQSKPWLEIGFEHLRPFWTKYVNYSNDFIRNCHILDSVWLTIGARAIIGMEKTSDSRCHVSFFMIENFLKVYLRRQVEIHTEGGRVSGLNSLSYLVPLQKMAASPARAWDSFFQSLT